MCITKLSGLGQSVAVDPPGRRGLRAGGCSAQSRVSSRQLDTGCLTFRIYTAPPTANPKCHCKVVVGERVSVSQYIGWERWCIGPRRRVLRPLRPCIVATPIRIHLTRNISHPSRSTTAGKSDIAPSWPCPPFFDDYFINYCLGVGCRRLTARIARHDPTREVTPEFS